MIYVISIHYVTPCLSLDAGLQGAKKIPDFDSLNDTTDSTIRGMWCATQWQQAQILMIGIRSVKNCNPKCFFFFENVGKNNTFDGLSMLIGLFFPLKSSNFLDVYRLYARYFSIFRSIQVSICRVFRYQTEYLFRRACEYAMAQGVEVP